MSNADPKRNAAVLERIDHLELQVSDEKIARCQSQLQHLALMHSIAQREHGEAMAARQALDARLSMEYGVGAGDSIDVRSGAITRAKPPTPPDAPSSAPSA